MARTYVRGYEVHGLLLTHKYGIPQIVLMELAGVPCWIARSVWSAASLLPLLRPSAWESGSKLAALQTLRPFPRAGRICGTLILVGQKENSWKGRDYAAPETFCATSPHKPPARPTGLGVRQPSGAFGHPRLPKRPRAGALQDAGALSCRPRALTRMLRPRLALHVNLHSQQPKRRVSKKDNDA